MAIAGGTTVLEAVRRLDVSAQLRAVCLGPGADGYYDKVKELRELADRVSEIARSPRP